jgi:hypothetical protein
MAMFTTNNGKFTTLKWSHREKEPYHYKSCKEHGSRGTIKPQFLWTYVINIVSYLITTTKGVPICQVISLDFE